MQREARKTHHSVGGIDFWLERKSVKNVNLRIHSDGSVHVSAPPRLPMERIERFVESKAAWIAQRRERLAQATADAPTLWSVGEQVRVWGETLELVLTAAPSARAESVTRKGNHLVLAVSERWADSTETAVAHRKRLVDQWLTTQLRAALPDLFARYEVQMGVHATAIKLRRMKTRWGSCKVSEGIITLNTELVRFPPTCLESVVVHELCHLLEPSHNAHFHELQDRYYPAWRDARKLLNAAPPLATRD